MSDVTATESLRILIVENHADTLESIKLYLEDCGQEVSTCMTVKQAEALLPKVDWDLIICDIGLPDGTGWDLMEKVRKLPRRIFAVAMSGFGMNADSARSRAAGFRSHLLKPFKAAELDKIVAQAEEERRRTASHA